MNENYTDNQSRRRNKSKKAQKYTEDEVPVRDTSVEKPPPPPDGNYNDWELQFCKWYGWTWVKKSDKALLPPPDGYNRADNREDNYHQNDYNNARPEEEKKKSGGLFSCFKKKKKPPAAEQPPPMRDEQTFDDLSERYPPNQRNFNSNDDCCCCCCMHMEACCCCCRQPVYCPCMMQQKSFRTQKDTQTQRKECHCMETQTLKEVKETSTKTSETFVPQQQRRRKCCKCCRPMCCPCSRPVCPCICPCLENNNNTQASANKTKKSKATSYDKESNYGSPTSFNAMYFSSMCKNLDFLLKNNISFTKLMAPKDLDYKPLNSFSSHDTITSLSQSLKKSDPEHSKLLTAVCDAILSSHKFDTTIQSYKPQVICKNDDSIRQIQPKKSFTKIVKRKSKVQMACRAKKPAETVVRKTYKTDLKSLKRTHVKDNNGKDAVCLKHRHEVNCKGLNLDNIENLLCSIECIDSSSGISREDVDKKSAPSTSFTNVDFLLNLDDDKREDNV